MPRRHGLEVSVVSSMHKKFTEYGVNTHARSKLVNAKIEARTGVQFYIVIRPEHPFPAIHDQRRGSSISTRAQASDRSAMLFEKTPPTPRKATPKVKISDLDTYHGVREPAKKIRDDRTKILLDLGTDGLIGLKPWKLPPSIYAQATDLNLLSAPLSAANTQDPPFDLVAEVFLDGRAKAEIRSIIYLDPKNSQPGTVLTGRRVRALGENDGLIQTCFHDWVFTDVAIEILLERMGVKDTVASKSGLMHEDRDVAGLADMLQDKVNVDKQPEAERELNVGKIEVVFTRVVLGKSTRSASGAALNSLHFQGGEHQTPKMSVGKDVTHTTSVVAPNALCSPVYKSRGYHGVKWTHYNPAEDFYAKFTFDYTSRAKLVKWGLCDETGVPVEKKTGKRKSCAESEKVDCASENGGGNPKDKGKNSLEKHTGEQAGSDNRGKEEEEEQQPSSVWEANFLSSETRSMKEKHRTAKRSFGAYGANDDDDDDDGTTGEGEGKGERKNLVRAGHGEDRRARLRPRK